MYCIFRCYKHPTEEDDMGPVIKEAWKGRRQVISTQIFVFAESINLSGFSSTKHPIRLLNCILHVWRSHTPIRVDSERVDTFPTSYTHITLLTPCIQFNNAQRQQLFTTRFGFSTCVMESWICRSLKHSQWRHRFFYLKLYSCDS